MAASNAYDFHLPASCPDCRRGCVWDGRAWVCTECGAIHTGNMLPTLGLDTCCGCGRTVDLAKDEDLPTCIRCHRRLCRGCWLDCETCEMPCCPKCGVVVTLEPSNSRAWRLRRACKECA